MEFATSADEEYGENLAAKHRGWEVEAIGAKLYQAAVLILRGSGSYSTARKINRRGTEEGECGSLTGNGNGGWKTIRINDWFLTPIVGVMSHVLVSTFEISGPPMGKSRTGRKVEDANRNFRGSFGDQFSEEHIR